MLQTYQAEINGSHLKWLDTPPKALPHERVVVVYERPAHHDRSAAVQAFMNAQGCLGKSSRDEILQQLDELRAEWDRNLFPSSNQ